MEVDSSCKIESNFMPKLKLLIWITIMKRSFTDHLKS